MNIIVILCYFNIIILDFTIYLKYRSLIQYTLFFQSNIYIYINYIINGMNNCIKIYI